MYCKYWLVLTNLVLVLIIISIAHLNVNHDINFIRQVILFDLNLFHLFLGHFFLLGLIRLIKLKRIGDLLFLPFSFLFSYAIFADIVATWFTMVQVLMAFNVISPAFVTINACMWWVLRRHSHNSLKATFALATARDEFLVVIRRCVHATFIHLCLRIERLYLHVTIEWLTKNCIAIFKSFFCLLVDKVKFTQLFNFLDKSLLQQVILSNIWRLLHWFGYLFLWSIVKSADWHGPIIHRWLPDKFNWFRLHSIYFNRI